MTRPQPLHLHEEIMLLALRDREGTIEFGAYYLQALGGAILAELLLHRRLRVEEDGKKKIAHVADASPLGEPVLDECLAKVAAEKKLRTLQHWVGAFAGLDDLKDRVALELCRRGILRAGEDTVLLLFTRRVYPEVDPAPEREIVARLENAVLTDAADVHARTVVLLSLAKATGLLRAVFDRKTLKSRYDRIEQIVKGELAGRALGDAVEAIQAMQAALFVTVYLPMMTTTAIH